MKRFSIVIFMLLLVIISVAPAIAQEPVVVNWFVGLGTGAQPEHIDPTNAFVEAFNASQDAIVLEVNIVDNEVAYDTLATLIASGQAPDIVGPVGYAGSWAFAGNWLDLEPLVESSGVDLSIWPETAVEFNRTEQAGLIGLPFAVFPMTLYYNRDLFDEAGLPYPPQEFGADYDGDEWNWDTLREIAMLMTLDENGNDATMDEFDPSAIVQFGYEAQWQDPIGVATMFGAGSLSDADGNALMPDTFRDGLSFWYDAMHVDHFTANESYRGSDLLSGGNPFSSGRVAMATTHLWYTCCIDAEAVPNWDLAVVPSRNGVNTANLHADTFRILNTSENSEAAFDVVWHFLTEGSEELLLLYGAFPSNPDDVGPFVTNLNERFPQGVNWQVVVDSLAFADIPSHEQWMPNYSKAFDAWGALGTLLSTDPDLDVNAELDRHLTELQAMYEEVQ